MYILEFLLPCLYHILHKYKYYYEFCVKLVQYETALCMSWVLRDIVKTSVRIVAMVTGTLMFRMRETYFYWISLYVFTCLSQWYFKGFSKKGTTLCYVIECICLPACLPAFLHLHASAVYRCLIKFYSQQSCIYIYETSMNNWSVSSLRHLNNILYIFHYTRNKSEIFHSWTSARDKSKVFNFYNLVLSWCWLIKS